VMQMSVGEVQQHKPAFDINGNQPGLGHYLADFEPKHAQRSFAQALTHITGGQKR